MAAIAGVVAKIRYGRRPARGIGRVIIRTSPGSMREVLCEMFDEKTEFIGHYVELLGVRGEVPSDIVQWAARRIVDISLEDYRAGQFQDANHRPEHLKKVLEVMPVFREEIRFKLHRLSDHEQEELGPHLADQSAA